MTPRRAAVTALGTLALVLFWPAAAFAGDCGGGVSYEVEGGTSGECGGASSITAAAVVGGVAVALAGAAVAAGSAAAGMGKPEVDELVEAMTTGEPAEPEAVVTPLDSRGRPYDPATGWKVALPDAGKIRAVRVKLAQYDAPASLAEALSARQVIDSARDAGWNRTMPIGTGESLESLSWRLAPLVPSEFWTVDSVRSGGLAQLTRNAFNSGRGAKTILEAAAKVFGSGQVHQIREAIESWQAQGNILGLMSGRLGVDAGEWVIADKLGGDVITLSGKMAAGNEFDNLVVARWPQAWGAAGEPGELYLIAVESKGVGAQLTTRKVPLLTGEEAMLEEQGTPGYLWQTLPRDAKLAAELERREGLRELVQGLIDERALRYIEVRIDAAGRVTVSAFELDQDLMDNLHLRLPEP